jgi:predicted RecA/RadA family phage recombinase
MYKNPGIVKSFFGSGAIGANLIVKFGADDSTVSPAAAATDFLLGITNEIALIALDVTNGNTVDVTMSGVEQLKLGAAAVTRGQKLTSNASGQGITAAPAAGSNVQVIGIALKSGNAGDVIPVLIMPSVMQG